MTNTIRSMNIIRINIKTLFVYHAITGMMTNATSINRVTEKDNTLRKGLG